MTESTVCPDCGSSAPPHSSWCEACGCDLNTAGTPDRTVATPDRTVATPERTVATPDNTVVTPDNTATTPDNTVVTPAAGSPPSEGATAEGSEQPQAAPPESPEAASWHAPCISCGASKEDIAADGWCTMCGQRQPTQQDHAEIDAGTVAAVTDRGLRHHRNEDAIAIAERPAGAIAVVCDGVSSTELPDQGAQAACDAALDVLVAHWDKRFATSAAGGDGEADDPEAAGDVGLEGVAAWIEEATTAANDAVATVIASAGELSGEPPSCTMVAAVARTFRDQVTIWIGWLGDSRAYWVTGFEGQLLTVDHSWAALQSERGELASAEIAADPRANSITRWVGPDSPNNRAEVRRFDFATPGRLILCTDGLWRYADSAADMALRSAEAGDAAMDAARNLADLALTSGGHDNISVAVFDAGVVNALDSPRESQE